ncbi:Hsp20/alpha crystallin family protein [Amycolatopsis magusensis]|uniref:Hsp20/alpha crystallin family protein n=1 Tax=Amycolatopsis magusensis TaxID=882444 RepID=UPI00379D285D
MLLRTDPFREFDRLTQQFFGSPGTRTRPAAMPMDAYRAGDDYVVEFDLPGVSAESIDLDVERNVLTVRAERETRFGDDVEVSVSERPRGVFSRQLFLGDTLDTDRIEADYHGGVLTLRIPVTERAKPRKITVGSRDETKQIDA